MIVAKITDQKDDLVSAEIIQDLRVPETKKLFDEFSDLINNQVFSLLDKIETEIDDLEISIEPGFKKIKDIQIFDSHLTFKIKNGHNKM